MRQTFSDPCVATSRFSLHVQGREAMLLCLVCAGFWVFMSTSKASDALLWDMSVLSQPPTAQWGIADGRIRTVYFSGEYLNGRPTRVFAYYARPAKGTGPFPAIVLAHGGGGKAFRDWALHWAERGYIAMAMDLSGNGPDGLLADGGPVQDDAVKFRAFDDADVKNMWSYHAVSAIVRAHSLLLSQKEVDPARTALHGISWGGYLSCIVAGVDHRFKAVVSSYGCGFIADESAWVETYFDRMPPDNRRRWVNAFDPSNYLVKSTTPMLFITGANDPCYPLGILTKSASLVQSPVTLSLRIDREHGHIWTFPEVDAFINQQLQRAEPLVKLSAMSVKEKTVTTTATPAAEVVKAELCYAFNDAPWRDRKWQSVQATVRNGRIEAALPRIRGVQFFINATDRAGQTVSTMPISN